MELRYVTGDMLGSQIYSYWYLGPNAMLPDEIRFEKGFKCPGVRLLPVCYVKPNYLSNHSTSSMADAKFQSTLQTLKVESCFWEGLR
ncbi:hypothetical protein BEST7613_2306 [Synechocystis sp. PCC 6803]|nr:hypothetical protein BEST7613_2306 [Synechocystis sp. PCC 6803] [Bacillus subtilis BEST7613]